MILGVVLAGGKSSRFGSDKALAELDGHTLLAHAVDALSGWCEYVVIVGREVGPAPTLPDWPKPGMGPLGGLAAGLHLARDEDYEAVMTCGVDSIGLPSDLDAVLTPANACLRTQPVIGLWRPDAIAAIERILTTGEKQSMYHFAEAVGARMVDIDGSPANINTPADLAAAARQR